jgi:hypothetical protein
MAIEVTQEGAKTNTVYNPGVASQHNSGINPATPIPVRFHPGLPTQELNSVWTFNGTVPPKLAINRYGEPVLLRHRNKLPADIRQNNGFGRHTISTHEHNGHHGAENDGFTWRLFFPGCSTTITGRSSWRAISASTPLPWTSRELAQRQRWAQQVPGDWHETMSTGSTTMFEHTAENVQGQRRDVQPYSGLDRGNEAINDGVNLRCRVAR